MTVLIEWKNQKSDIFKQQFLFFKMQQYSTKRVHEKSPHNMLPCSEFEQAFVWSSIVYSSMILS